MVINVDAVMGRLKKLENTQISETGVKDYLKHTHK